MRHSMARHVVTIPSRPTEVSTNSFTIRMNKLLTFLLIIGQTKLIVGFTAGQPAPWISPLNDNPNLKLHDVYIIRRPSKKCSSAVGTADIDVMDGLNDDNEKDDRSSSEKNATHTFGSRESPSMVANISTRIPLAPDVSTIKSSMSPLWKMTRPGNFVGVLCFHALGIYRSLSSQNLATTQNLIKIAMKPSMLATLLSLMLICSTSMLVNDYYDGRSGLDSYKISNPINGSSSAVQGNHKNYKINKEPYKPLVSGEVTYPVTKRFLSYLYTAILVSATILPGVTTRLSVVTASMVTFWYTQHLKPKTWLKNVACASLIALAPFTSGSATLHLLSNGSMSSVQGLQMAWSQMGRLTLALFSGVMGREIIMDIGDVDADKLSSVLTVPVRYGRRFAGSAGLGCMISAAIFTTFGPFMQLLTSESSVGSLLQSGGDQGMSMIAAAWSVPALRRLLFAVTGSAWLVTRAYQVKKTEGRDDIILDRTIEDSKICVLLVLASFL